MGTIAKYLNDFQAEIETAVNGFREAGIAAGVDVVSQRDLLPVIDPTRNPQERALIAAAKASIPDGAEAGTANRIRALYAVAGAFWVRVDDVEYTTLSSENTPTTAEMEAASPKDYIPFVQHDSVVVDD